MPIIFIRSIILYILLIFSVRFMGKRQIGELQPSELAITILVSNIATLPIEDPGLPLLVGILPILTLISLDVVMSFLSVKSRGIRRLMCGQPVIIINNGVIDQKKMKELRFTNDDLTESLRMQGVFDINEVQFAVVETTGAVSVYQKFKNQTATNESVGKEGKNENPPYLVIDNGSIVRDGLDVAGITESQLKNILKKEKAAEEDVFIMTAAGNADYFIVKKVSK
jgi:uncharacterized membrane protein YcaP (DUF421 family)